MMGPKYEYEKIKTDHYQTLEMIPEPRLGLTL